MTEEEKKEEFDRVIGGIISSFTTYKKDYLLELKVFIDLVKTIVFHVFSAGVDYGYRIALTDIREDRD